MGFDVKTRVRGADIASDLVDQGFDRIDEGFFDLLEPDDDAIFDVIAHHFDLNLQGTLVTLDGDQGGSAVSFGTGRFDRYSIIDQITVFQLRNKVADDPGHSFLWGSGGAMTTFTISTIAPFGSPAVVLVFHALN